MNSRPRYDIQVNTDWLLALMTLAVSFAVLVLFAAAAHATTATAVWGASQ